MNKDDLSLFDIIGFEQPKIFSVKMEYKEPTKKEKLKMFWRSLKEHISGIFFIFMLWVGITMMATSTAFFIKSVLF